MKPSSAEPAADPRLEAVRAFGRYLLRERELRGLSHEDVVRVTRLAAGVVEAIESGEPERMPPRGYLVGYLRSYAGAVGLDPDDVVLRFQEAAGIEEPEAAPGAARASARALASHSPTGRRWIAIGVAVVLVVAAIAAVAARRGRGDAGEIRGRKSTERAPYRAPGAP
ncbi:MAG: helix-turn-helix transcriptional regulator [Deltaproteobacteria bacterium]